jgi:hypothetical protein
MFPKREGKSAMARSCDMNSLRRAGTARELRWGAALAVALPAAMTACGEPSPQGSRTPADQAAFMEKTRCSGDDEATLAPVLSGSAIMGVQPLYSNVGSAKNGPEPQLRGASVKVAALPGMTPELLDRELECHCAKVTLGLVAAAADDPFSLPGASIDIDVRPAKDAFEVAVAAYSTDDAHKILDRANAFAKAKSEEKKP